LPDGFCGISWAENALFGLQIYGVLNTTIFATPPADMTQNG
jgi:hypothetical protein